MVVGIFKFSISSVIVDKDFSPPKDWYISSGFQIYKKLFIIFSF